MNKDIDIEICTVLNKEIRSENSLYIIAYSPTHGIIHLFKRLSKKKTSSSLDIFDNISLIAKSKLNSPLFFSDFEILKSRKEIGLSYNNLISASKITNFLLNNAIHLDNPAYIHNILNKALDNITVKTNPLFIEIKFYYLICKKEGYAVIEDFLKNLSKQHQDLFTLIISLPSKDLSQLSEFAEEIYSKFTTWIQTNTDFIL